jgi:dihydroorotase
MDMPNTVPNTLTQELLEEKYQQAARTSLANYSFFMGITQGNLEEALRTDNETVCGITDDGLYFNKEDGILANYPDFLDKLFSRSNTLIALHCEDDSIIRNNTEKYRAIYGDDIPFKYHALIRSREACLEATKRVVDIARKHQNRLHIFHVSTVDEALLFDHTTAIREKRITAEACVHHLWFDDRDYERLGAKIKWNPSVKEEKDKRGLLQALLDNHIDIIATDHAPHTVEEKSGNYFKAHSGGPLVQHALVALLELYHQGVFTLEKIVRKSSHNVADMFAIDKRGFIREGYFADMVLVDLNSPWIVRKENVLYKCGWSPFEGQTFKSKVISTWVNGNKAYDNGHILEGSLGKRLTFNR